MSQAITSARHGPLKWAVGIAVGALVLGAVYLILVRGPALMLDLQGLSRYMWCF